MAGLASLTLVAGLTVAATPAAADPLETSRTSGGATVEAQVHDELAANGSTTFWVYLNERPDVSAAAEADWANRGQIVYDALTATAERSQARLRSLLAAEQAPYESFWIANVVKVTGDEQLLTQITSLPEVTEVAADRTYSLVEPEAGDTHERIHSVEWNVDRVNAPQVWDEFGATGEGIIVGSIDTGVQYDHPALVNQYAGNLGNGQFDHNYHWWDPSDVCGSPSLAPCDNNGHGTHVTGTMVGDDGGDNQIGVAPRAKWIAAKGCESTGCSRTALLSSGQFILAPTDLHGDNPDPSRRPHIVNNSWGGGNDNEPWYEATVQAWVDAGIFPQFAIGNAGPSCGSAGNPGNLPESYASGGFDINDNVYTSSSRGPSAFGGIIKPDISAPAVGIRSSLPNNGYGALTGTSMASPHVAGAVALMWEAAPTLVRDVDATRALLDGTAEETEDLTCGGEPGHNNVWGHGKLDAHAAVDRAPRTDTGTLAGTVTDGDTGDAIAGATVTITGEVDRSRTTDADGRYEAVLPEGQYEVSVEAFGYRSDTATVTITADATTEQDFALNQVDSVTISGTVTDGGGHGWPLYATVDVTGSPLSTYTDPVTGEYEITVPAEASYTLTVDAYYPGYRAQSDTVEVGTGDVTHDAALPVNVASCLDAPGYRLDQPRIAMVTSLPAQFQAYFDDRGVAVDYFTGAQLDQVTGYDLVLWGYHASAIDEGMFLDFLDTTDSDGAGVIFLDHAFTNWNGIKTLSNHTGAPESVSTNTGGSGQSNMYEIVQEHPVVEGFEVGQRILHEPGLTAWLAWFDGYEGDGREVIAHAGRDGDGVLGSGIGVQERANNRHVLLSIHAQSSTRGPSDWSEESEQILWNAIDWASPVGGSFECVAEPGGLVVGHVTEQNTGTGVIGATVTSQPEPEDQGRSVAVADDPAMDDGFFWLFSSHTGDVEFTASGGGYVDDIRQVDVVPSGTVRADFALGAGQLTVDPTEIDVTHRMGQTSQGSFTISNSGSAAVEVELSPRPGSFEILGGSVQQPAAVESNGGSYLSAAGLKVNPQFDPNATTTEGQYTGGVRPQVTPGEAGDVIRSWAPGSMSLAWGVGYDGNVWLSDPNVLSNHEFTVEGQETGSHQTDWAGTWPGDMTLLNPGEMCQVNVGGDNGIYCWDTSSEDVTRAITDSFAWNNISQRGLAHRADDDTFYIGGWNENIVYQVAGFSHATPGEIVNQCSLAGAGVSGLAWNPTAELLWVATNSPTDDVLLVDPSDCEVLDALAHPSPNYNGGGLHMDDVGNLWMVSQDENLVYLIDSGVPHASEVPWLSYDPEAMTLQPGDSVTVTLTMDASIDEVLQPGTYTAGILIGHNTPYEVPMVDVAMHVTPPTGWGKITGTVAAVDCSGETSPVGGAIVQLNGRQDQVTLRTGGDGTYAYWMSNRNNPLQVIVATGSHVPQVRNSIIVPRQETVEDFTLSGICGLSIPGEHRPL